MTAVDMAPGMEVEFADAWAVTVTMPVCMHCAMPFWLMVAMFMSETLHPPENGATKVTVAGDGGLLKVPMAANCTWPIAKFIPLAVPGVTVMDISMRFWFIMSVFVAPQPTIVSNAITTQVLHRCVLRREGLKGDSFDIVTSGICVKLPRVDDRALWPKRGGDPVPRFCG